MGDSCDITKRMRNLLEKGVKSLDHE